MPFRNIKKRLCGGSSKGLPLFISKGFSSFELLVVCAITIIMLGVFCAGFRPLFRVISSCYKARQEAERFALWFESQLTKGRLERTSCIIRLLPGDRPVDQIRITWDTGEREIYDAHGRAWFQMGGFNRAPLYSPYWHTISPAFVLDVSTRPQQGEKVCKVIVSPHCFVSIEEKR